MIPLTPREWQRISYGEDADSLPAAQADRIAAVAARSAFAGAGGEGVLEHGRKGLRARAVVGMIATDGCQLQILPRIKRGGEAGAATRLGRQNDTLLELLIRLFRQRLIEAARHGIPRRHVVQDDDLPALRGRL